MSETTAPQSKIKLAKSLLMEHEELGSAYLDSQLPDKAYGIVVDSINENEYAEVDFDTAEVAMLATSMQAKLLLKQNSTQESQSKYNEALHWSNRALELTDDPSLQCKIYAQQGLFHVRLKDFESASTSFENAHILGDEDPQLLAEILLYEHHIYASGDSPMYDPESAVSHLQEAQRLFKMLGDEKHSKYAERYILAVLARSKKIGKLAKHIVKSGKSMMSDRGQLAKRFAKGK